ncbi:MAG TPA: hypothetical protein VMU76_04105 [Acidimicrobiales bacterium]|nr:hypothetical protein [Acidimicrobiales bacterium]
MERLIAVWCPALLHEGERGEEVREFARIVSVAESFCPWVDTVRLGVCALPSRGPSRFFGGESMVVAKLAAALAAGAPGAGEGDGGGVYVGAADGLFAAVLAARSRLTVPRGGTADFLAPWSVAVLRRTELAVTLQRLGVRTLGQFAALPARHVLARFGTDGAACHRVASGSEGELLGLRDPGVDRRPGVARGDEDEAERPHQPGFFGGRSAADVRAASSFARVQDRLGVEEVLVGRLQGGRSPAERARLVPWGSRGTAGPDSTRSERATARRGDRAAPAPAPWPGRIPAPSPVRVLHSPVAVEVVDRSGCPVRVNGRGLLASEPALLSVDGGPWQEVAAWAGPWPATERWWSTRRRRARLQVVTGAGMATLLSAERERWWMEGVYE